MEIKKIYLEQLFEKIRTLAEEYEMDAIETDAVLFKEKELSVFSEDLIQVVNNFIKNELNGDEELDIEEESDEEFYITDWFDDDLD